jgi:hypothetical protein
LGFVFWAATGKIRYEFDEQVKPVAAVEFLKQEKLKGNLFNTDIFGDYLIYAAWPQYKVFIDTRSDMYGSALMEEYNRVLQLAPGWEQILGKYDIRWIFCQANSPLSALLAERRDWQPIYRDPVADIFLKDLPENQDIVKKSRSFKNP